MAGKAGEIVPFTEQFPALGGSDIVGALRENLGGEKLNVFDLEAVKIPAGGGIAWTLLDAEGEQQVAKTFSGIIVFQRMVRSFWEKGLDESTEGSTPPDCSSDDAIIGHGNPGGECAVCPYSQWGSGKNGRGQACNHRRQLFVLTPGIHMPVLLSLPPTSLKPAKDYLMRLSSRSTRYMGVVTKFGLTQTTGGGFTYSVVTFDVERKLDADELAAVNAYATELQPIFVQTPVTAGIGNTAPSGDDTDGI